jgi:hypothetical protein
MKKTNCFLLLASVALTIMLTGCPQEAINPSSSPSPSPSPSPTTTPATITLSRIDLYLCTPYQTNTTGDIVLEVRDAAGTTILANMSITASSPYQFSWRRFDLPASIELNRGATYRIYVQRTSVHKISTDSICWGSLPGAYPAGMCSIPDDANHYAFLFQTYSGGNIDQESGGSGGISNRPYLYNTTWLWQDFIPGN